jgi:anaerobic dimethyl sulfoxide reductase subunit B (iron-sulfur subunit)
MATYGLLIDYEYCSGCQSCEVSCKEEHNYPVGQWGIRVFDDGPWAMDDGSFNWNKIAIPTDLCDLCADRTAKGKEPICVHHCLANVMRYGTVEELAESLKMKPKQVLWVPQFKPLRARGEFISKHPGRKYDHTIGDLFEIKGGSVRIAGRRENDGLAEDYNVGINEQL